VGLVSHLSHEAFLLSSTPILPPHRRPHLLRCYVQDSLLVFLKRKLVRFVPQNMVHHLPRDCLFPPPGRFLASESGCGSAASSEFPTRHPPGHWRLWSNRFAPPTLPPIPLCGAVSSVRILAVSSAFSFYHAGRCAYCSLDREPLQNFFCPIKARGRHALPDALLATSPPLYRDPPVPAPAAIKNIVPPLGALSLYFPNHLGFWLWLEKRPKTVPIVIDGASAWRCVDRLEACAW